MSDEVMQDLDRLMRTGFTVAAQLAEQHRRGAAEAERQRRDRDVASRQAAVDEARAVQQAARAHYDKVGWADWRDSASLDDWATAYQHAHAMRAYDPVAATAHNRIEDEVRKRYNLDIREALELHLQQIAEDQRVRAEHDAAQEASAPTVGGGAGPDLKQGVPSANGEVDGVASSPATQSDSARATTTTEPPSRISTQGDVVIQGEVVSDEEMHQAQSAAREAGRGFGQQAGDAVRHSRARSTSGHQANSSNNSRRGARHDVDLTRSR